MEAQPWWELSAWACSCLQSWALSTCSTSSPGWRGSKTGWSRSSSCSSSSAKPSCTRFHQRGEKLLEGHLEESLCHVVKKVPFEVNFYSKLPPGVKSRALLCLEVLPDQQRHFEGNGGHGGHLPHHPDPVQVGHPGHAFIDILSRKAIYGTIFVASCFTKTQQTFIDNINICYWSKRLKNFTPLQETCLCGPKFDHCLPS